jgi:hypothetical protein
MLIIWGGLLGAFFRRRPDGARVWWVIAALVVSHWLLDWITHRPDMPVYPGGEKYGLSLWNNVPAVMTIEVVMFLFGVWDYSKTTTARDSIGRWGFLSLVALLLGFYLFDSFDPPVPPSVPAIWAWRSVSDHWGGRRTAPALPDNS